MSRLRRVVRWSAKLSERHGRNKLQPIQRLDTGAVVVYGLAYFIVVNVHSRWKLQKETDNVLCRDPSIHHIDG